MEILLNDTEDKMMTLCNIGGMPEGQLVFGPGRNVNYDGVLFQIGFFHKNGHPNGTLDFAFFDRDGDLSHAGSKEAIAHLGPYIQAIPDEEWGKIIDYYSTGAN